MKLVRTVSASIMLAALTMISCDDTTEGIGTSIMPADDAVAASQQIFLTSTSTVKAANVSAYTGKSYLGRIVDPETDAITSCGFLAQYYISEDFSLPENIVKDEMGNAICDSCEVRVFVDSYYGDSLATMKLLVEELDTNNVMTSKICYTDFKPEQYIGTTPHVKETTTFTLRDENDKTTAHTANSYANFVVKMPSSLGQRLLNSYYSSPQYFRNSFEFNRHVFAGLMFKVTGGAGVLASVPVSTFDIYFRYHDKTAAGADTIVSGFERIAATSEVVQNTFVENIIPDGLLTPTADFTYIKSPSALQTELTLPVDSIFIGQHNSDTINSASLTLRRYNDKPADSKSATLNPPSMLLMVPKAEAQAFFENEMLPDNISTFTTSFNQNGYTFSNIARLIVKMKSDRDTGAGILSTDNEAQRKAKYAAWEAKADNADWNKVLLIPVTPTFSSSTSIYSTTSTLVRLRQDLSLSSVKLMGGTKAPQITVTYTRFSN